MACISESTTESSDCINLAFVDLSLKNLYHKIVFNFSTKWKENNIIHMCVLVCDNNLFYPLRANFEEKKKTIKSRRKEKSKKHREI